MNKLLKKEFRLQKRAKILFIILAVIFVTSSIYIFNSLYAITRNIILNQAEKSISNVSKLNAESIGTALKNRITLLETISKRLEEHKVYDIDEILDEMRSIEDAYNFYGIGVVDKDLVLHFISGDTFDVRSMPQNDLMWDGAAHVYASYMPLDGGEHAVNMFSAPLFKGEEIEYILVATYQSINLTQRMNTEFMEDKGYNFLVNTNGEVVIYPHHYDDEEYNALMKHINDTPDIIPEEGSNSTFEYNGKKYYAHFEHLNVSDWHLMTCARESAVFEDANIIIDNIFIGISILWWLVIVAIITIAYFLVRARNEFTSSVFYDGLLGIGNSKSLPLFFKSIIETNEDTPYLVVFDIDKFKEFNYIYGEEQGDNLLKYIVKVLRRVSPEAQLFRVAADVFVVIDYAATDKDYENRIKFVLNIFKRDIKRGKIQPFDISAGVRRVNRGESLRHTMSDALIAKGTIKGIQMTHYAFYDESIRRKRIEYMSMESGFEQALANGEFHVYYQPKYNMSTGKITGAEALARWVKPDGTIISPGAFIPCFEASRQIIYLDQAILQTVCRQMKEMENEGIEVRKVSVNLSRVHLRQPDTLWNVENIIKETGVDPSKISFEITESALYEDSIPLKSIVDFIHGLGCKVDMDDYGIGVSGPRALADNMFDTIKLDKSFIDGIGKPRMETVIESTIVMSRRLGMRIVAEGVEEVSQVDYLVKCGCNTAQGFYYSKPVPVEEYRKLLMDN